MIGARQARRRASGRLLNFCKSIWTWKKKKKRYFNNKGEPAVASFQLLSSAEASHGKSGNEFLHFYLYLFFPFSAAASLQWPRPPTVRSTSSRCPPGVQPHLFSHVLFRVIPLSSGSAALADIKQTVNIYIFFCFLEKEYCVLIMMPRFSNDVQCCFRTFSDHSSVLCIAFLRFIELIAKSIDSNPVMILWNWMVPSSNFFVSFW